MQDQMHQWTPALTKDTISNVEYQMRNALNSLSEGLSIL